MNEQLWNTTATAKFLGVKNQTLRKWRLDGKGPRYIRLGDDKWARVVYRPEDVSSWLEARTFSSPTEETVR